MKVEAFIFNDEIELLEARFRETGDSVDLYVVIESEQTFTGGSKPLYFAENKDQFALSRSEIAHVVADLPKNGTAWDRERAQRNALHQVIDDLDGDAIVTLCDGDELVSAEYWDQIEEFVDAGTVVLPMRQHYFTLTWATPAHPPPDGGEMARSRVARRSAIEEAGAWADGQFGIQFLGSGWHLSCLGGPERLLKKLSSFSHTELSNPSWANLENCTRMIRDGIDIDPVRQWPLERVEPAGPEWLITEGVKKWPWLLTGGVDVDGR
jgi:beta-1,4-mannosyl-glycoprotein beta-1,4-N-acetylglucosaminyltransferase